MSKPSGPYETVVPTQGRSDRVANARAYMGEMARYANTGRLGLETLARLQCGPGLRLVKDGAVWVVAGVPIGLLDETAEEREAELAAASLPGVTRASDLAPAVNTGPVNSPDVNTGAASVNTGDDEGRNAYMREYMRKRRAAGKGGDDG